MEQVGVQKRMTGRRGARCPFQWLGNQMEEPRETVRWKGRGRGWWRWKVERAQSPGRNVEDSTRHGTGVPDRASSSVIKVHPRDIAGSTETSSSVGTTNKFFFFNFPSRSNADSFLIAKISFELYIPTTENREKQQQQQQKTKNLTRSYFVDSQVHRLPEIERRHRSVPVHVFVGNFQPIPDRPLGER